MLKITILLLSLLLNVYGDVAPRLALNDGHSIPIVGLGTWKSGSEVYQAVLDAIEIGWRHIDTSLDYGTEQDIGKAIKQLIADKKITREELFITSKLEGDAHSRALVPTAINKSLTNLGLSYLDLYLVHFPDNDAAIVDTWKGMEDVHEKGLTKSIGVSNFNQNQVELVLANAKVKPVTNQILCNPYRNEKPTLAYLTSKNITMTCYSPLGGDGEVAKLTSEPKIVAIAKAHNVTGAQVVLRYQIERNVIAIPKTVQKKYLIEDFDLFSFKLTDDEVKSIETMN
jgi:aldehyde reductase